MTKETWGFFSFRYSTIMHYTEIEKIDFMKCETD